MNQRGRKRGHLPLPRSQGQSWSSPAGCVSQDSLLALSEPHCPHVQGGHTLCKMMGGGVLSGSRRAGVWPWVCAHGPQGRLRALPLTPASLCGFPYSSTPFAGWGDPHVPKRVATAGSPTGPGCSYPVARVSRLSEMTEPLCPLSLPWEAHCTVPLQDARGAPNTDATGAGEEGRGHCISSSLVKQ